ncbi:MAG: TIGR04283 family arsenosugar biosynthesis glycosyltransferase [Burkholderiales bacterium]|nr:TIGR04283 family arsenosugar biosynthesis glycosyltransferase [Burkholderiales bacterium]
MSRLPRRDPPCPPSQPVRAAGFRRLALFRRDQANAGAGIRSPPAGLARPGSRGGFVRPDLAIIVPVLEEAPSLASRLQALEPLRRRRARVVVVDGGSRDDTLAIGHARADLALRAPRGRAAQMNAGAAACPADLLLFLHADTALPDRADALIVDACGGRFGWGRFDVHIESREPLLRIVAALMNIRSRVTGIATGDQALFVRHELFQRIGGFPDLPLMEDIAISRRLKRQGPPACLRERVTTSARRWERHGVWRTIFLMWRLRAAFFLGADPRQLARDYGYRPR